MTTDPDFDETPEWSPDSRTIAHQGNIGQSSGIQLTTIDVSRSPRQDGIQGTCRMPRLDGSGP